MLCSRCQCPVIESHDTMIGDDRHGVHLESFRAVRRRPLTVEERHDMHACLQLIVCCPNPTPRFAVPWVALFALATLTCGSHCQRVPVFSPRRRAVLVSRIRESVLRSVVGCRAYRLLMPAHDVFCIINLPCGTSTTTCVIRATRLAKANSMGIQF